MVDDPSELAAVMVVLTLWVLSVQSLFWLCRLMGKRKTQVFIVRS
jgi:hypothetical protein